MSGGRLALVLGTVALVGCATAPTSPSVMVLPAPGKPLDEFAAEDMVCRQFAQQQGGRQRQYDMAYQQCMYAKGNQIPGASSASRSSPPPAPAPSPGSPASPPESGPPPTESSPPPR